jgi:NAD(P)H-binding
MVICSGGLVNFINGSATPSPFCNEASSSPHRSQQTSTQQNLSSSKAMHFLLLGSSGRTGQHVLSELLSQSHTAVALVRTSGSLTPRPGLTIVTGSPLSKSDIRIALLAAPTLSSSAAIITLNTVRRSDSPFAAQISPPRFLLTRAPMFARFWSMSAFIAL